LRYRISTRNSFCLKRIIQANLNDFSNLNIPTSHDIAYRVRCLIIFLYLRRVTRKFNASTFVVRVQSPLQAACFCFLLPISRFAYWFSAYDIFFYEAINLAFSLSRGIYSLRVLFSIWLARKLFSKSIVRNKVAVDENLFVLPLHPYEAVSEFGDLESVLINKGETVSRLLLPTFTDFPYLRRSFAISNQDPSAHVLLDYTSFIVVLITCVHFISRSCQSVMLLLFYIINLRATRFAVFIESSFAIYSTSPASVNDMMQCRLYASFFKCNKFVKRVYSSFEGRGIELARTQIIMDACTQAKHLTIAHSTLSNFYLPHYVFLSLLARFKHYERISICLPPFLISLKGICTQSFLDLIIKSVPSCRYNYSYTEHSTEPTPISYIDSDELSILLLLDHKEVSSNQLLRLFSLAYHSFPFRVRIFIKKHPLNPHDIMNVSFPYEEVTKSISLRQRLFHMASPQIKHQHY